jgi:RNA polymerase sigma-70 factor (ECF subfamily)
VHVAQAEPAGDPAARIEALFTAHYDRVWRTLRRLGLPSGEADDAAQEVFMVALRRLDDIDPARARAFLSGVAVRVAADHRRHARRHPELPTEDVVLALRADPGPDVDERMDAARRRARLDALLDTLDDELRQVIVLHELEALTMAEIAAALELPPGTVASRLRRARERLEAAAARLAARTRGRAS